MITPDNEDRLRAASNLLHTYAPNAYATKVINEQLDWNNQVTVKDYVLALSDGLRYGNWPWTTNSTPKSTSDYVIPGVGK